MWRPALRLAAQQGAKSGVFRTIHSSPQWTKAGSQDIAETSAPSLPVEGPKIPIREAKDTSDLIDQLLWVLGPSETEEAGFVFFDLDETLVTRDTCLIDGLGSTRALMTRLEEQLGPASETIRTIHSEMERDYYSADPRLVDPLLARVIRALKIQGHLVFGLTSNALDRVHAPQILETLAKYKIRFSSTDVRGELPRSGALVMDHPVCRGVIFIDNQQAKSHDKGEVIAEFVSLLLHNERRAIMNHAGVVGTPSPGPEEKRVKDGRLDGGIAGGRTSSGSGASGLMFADIPSTGGIGGRMYAGSPNYDAAGSGVETGGTSTDSPRPLRKCVLVDNTSRKCEKAAASFARHKSAQGSLELHTLHFTEAENLVDSPDALLQMTRILDRMKARGLIGEGLTAEDLLVSPEGSDVHINVAGGNGLPPAVAAAAMRSDGPVVVTARRDNRRVISGTLSEESRLR